MSKRAVLRLDGRLEEGCRVTLEVGEEGSLHSAEEDGRLPPAPELIQCLEEWQQSYPFLEGTRIKLGNITVRPGVATQAEDCRQKAKKLQKQLKAWLGSGSFHVIDTQLREAVNRDDLIRVVLRCQDRRLHLLPWHTWDFIDRYHAEVAFSLPTRKSDQLGKSLKARKKVRILAILGDSDGIDTNVDRSILETLPDAEVVFLVEPLRQQLNEQLWEQPWDILFFAGHSQTKDCEGRIFINANDSLTIDDLRFALKRAIARGLQLAIFNSCDGLGLVYELEQLGIPQLVVMRQPVPDRVAHDFLKYLLAGLVKGQRFYLAVREAREKLQSLEDCYPCASWLPVIFQNPNQPPLTWQSLRFRREEGLEEHTRKGRASSSRNFELIPTQQKSRRDLLIVCLISVVISSFVLGARWHGKLQSWELQAFDLLMQQRPVEKPDDRILVIRATEEDLQRLKEPTLSDRTILQLLEQLKPYQPRAIGLDIFRDQPQGKGHAELLKHLQQTDNIFAICFGAMNDPTKPRHYPPAQVPAERIGFSDNVFDPGDRVIRRHMLRAMPAPASPCQTQSALSLSLALRYLKPQGINLGYNSKNQYLTLGQAALMPVQAHIGGYHQLDATKDLGGDQILLNYRSYHNIEDIVSQTTLLTILNVLKNTDKSYTEYFKDKIVLIGYDDRKSDYHKTPHGMLSGVFIHAHMVSQLLSAALKERSLLWWLPWWGDALWVLTWGLVGGMVTWWFRLPSLLGLAEFVMLSALYGLCYFFFIQGGWLPLVPSMFVLLLTSGSVLVYRMLQAQRYSSR
ncbi:MAG: CHASE2 domain-containing protein [Stenomitos rutilans HA7619-LM2]|jgi:CHASE2 domain-containing sensor protein|nr:CHASE2 domain-containing protein [Stenomitos rutilans HA7619-LM2]